MNETDARAWIFSGVSRETQRLLDTYVELLTNESARQNLVAASTLREPFTRHVVDALQLLKWDVDGVWIDVGSGGGLPGMVVAIARTDPVTLVEPRRLRAEFLEHVATALGLSNVSVIQTDIRKVHQPAAIISARAVASLSKLLEWTQGINASNTRYVLPKGRSAVAELEVARETWQGDFHVEPSITEAGSMIVVAEGVRRR